MIRVQDAPFDPSVELARFAADNPAAGAILSFTGQVRRTSDGNDVTRLALQHYPGFTEIVVREIADDTCSRFEIDGIFVIHRFGDLAPGEPIVFVAIAAAHRRPALEGIDYLMDRLKTEAPFWKRETGPSGTHWVEARPGDHADRARWGPDR